MNGKQKTLTPPAVGAATLLAVFAVLCLTVFAVLCLSTVQADDRLSRKSAQAVEEWYRADARAEEILARLRAGETVDGVELTDGTACYQVPISDSRSLWVEVSLSGTDYQVRRWQSAANEAWAADDTLNVWLGD